MTQHKTKIHGDLLLQKKKTRVTQSIKLSSGLSRSDSVKSGSSQPGSPPPKKLLVDKKEGETIKEKTIKLVEMEQSGGSGDQKYRECDDKINIGIQCSLAPTLNQQVRAGLMSKLEEDLKLAKQEIVDLKEDRKQLKSHNDRKHKGYELEYDELLKESSKMKDEINKILSEKYILLAKVNSLEKNSDDKDVDECVKDVNCQGNCEHVKCNTAQLQRLNILKNQGGRRNSPLETASISDLINCPQCNFTSRNKNKIEAHVRRVHGTQPSCPFCLVGFYNLTALKNHIQENHKENTAVNREGRQLGTRGQCIFFLQPRGCKKGDHCDFSHERGERYVTVKVRKLCFNGPSCNWKPRCRYVHLEDGEIIPPRSLREEGRRSQPREEGFGQPDCTQLPPGYTMQNYPGMGLPERPNMFRPWMISQESQ